MSRLEKAKAFGRLIKEAFKGQTADKVFVCIMLFDMLSTFVMYGYTQWTIKSAMLQFLIICFIGIIRLQDLCNSEIEKEIESLEAQVDLLDDLYHEAEKRHSNLADHTANVEIELEAKEWEIVCHKDDKEQLEMRISDLEFEAHCNEQRIDELETEVYELERNIQ